MTAAHRAPARYRGRRRGRSAVRTAVRNQAPYVGAGLVTLSALLVASVGGVLIVAGCLS